MYVCMYVCMYVFIYLFIDGDEVRSHNTEACSLLHFVPDPLDFGLSLNANT